MCHENLSDAEFAEFGDDPKVPLPNFYRFWEPHTLPFIGFENPIHYLL